LWVPLGSRAAFGQEAAAPALPLKNLGLEHLDILVPDTAASAQVYMRVFRTALHQQPFQGGLRYFILLGDLPQDRQVGYIAIGAAGNRPTSIGHYCALAERYDRAGVAQALKAAGYSAGSGGAFGMLPDPDGLELQLFQPPAGLVTAAVPSPLPVEGNGLVRPLGVDHVLLHVTDIAKSLPYYHLVYGAGHQDDEAVQSGPPLARTRSRHADRAAAGAVGSAAAHRPLLHQGRTLRPRRGGRGAARDRTARAPVSGRARGPAVRRQLRHHRGAEAGLTAEARSSGRGLARNGSMPAVLR
jgi:hypothetical protein